MLSYLHVKDLALIDEAEVEFGRHLNILTGETGAGKSIIIGSINLALGAKASRDMIRSGREYALVELVFSELDERLTERLRALEVYPEDGQLLISRRIGQQRSVIRINDEMVTLQKLRSVTELLLDIYGQHEHQSLLREGAHLRILDDYMNAQADRELRAAVAQAYEAFSQEKKQLAAFKLPESERQRELDFLRFELEEIETAALKEGEEERLNEEYRKYQHAQQIRLAIEETLSALEDEALGTALHSLAQARRFDEGLKDILDSLYDAQSILEEGRSALSHRLDSMELDEERLAQTEERLDCIRNCLMKYGGSVQAVEDNYQKKSARVETLEHYERARQASEKRLEEKYGALLALCERLSRRRAEAAGELCARIRTELGALGFLDVRFELALSRAAKPGRGGQDEASFQISLNPGEPLRPLAEAASGGELSRIMLSLKTIMADTDDIPSLIFDEIDSGISGQTAERVSDKLKKIAVSHQVICITHLPQIAAKADSHFEIKKSVEAGRTITHIGALSEEGSVQELARLLAGGRVTEAVLANARELKALAAHVK